MTFSEWAVNMEAVDALQAYAAIEYAGALMWRSNGTQAEWTAYYRLGLNAFAINLGAACSRYQCDVPHVPCTRRLAVAGRCARHTVNEVQS